MDEKDKPEEHFEETREPRDPDFEDQALIDPSDADDGAVPVDYDLREEHHAGGGAAGDDGEGEGD